MSKMVVVIELEDDECNTIEIINNFKNNTPPKMPLEGVVISIYKNIESYLEDERKDEYICFLKNKKLKG